MAGKLNHFIGRLLNRFTLAQKFTLISFIFGLAIAIAILWMISLQNATIRATSLEILGNHYERAVRSVYRNIALHRLLLNYKTDQSSLTEIENKIFTDFQNLINYDSQVEDDLKTKPLSFEKRGSLNLKPTEILQHWNQLLQNSSVIKIPESNRIHLEILNKLQALILYISTTSDLLQDPEIDNYYLIHTLYWLLAENLRLVPSINVEFENYRQLGKDNPKEEKESLDKLRELITIFNLHLTEMKDNIRNAISYEKNIHNNFELERTIIEPFQSTLQVYQHYINFINQQIEKKQPFDEETFFNDVKNVYEQNAAMSTIVSSILEKSLQARLDKLNGEKYLAIGITLFIALIAYLLGQSVMFSIREPLTKMMKSAIAIGNGDLSVRAPVFFDDEVGKVSQAFNKMADSLQDLLKQLQWAGIQLTTSTTEIAATAKQQEITVVEQESTTKEIAVTAKQISATARDFAQTMKDISETAEKTSSLATSGKEGLHNMEITMRQMVDAALNISTKLAVLNEKASSITSIVTTIAKVADQTNLLSLNAAIEAEKAGEQGRSFAVIAREIRRLADQTANATLDIEKMVTEMVSAVSAGVMGVDKFSDEIHTGVNQVSTAGEQLSKIIEQVQQLTGSFENVAQGMQAQSVGAEQINNSIILLSETAQQTSESIRQFHKSIDQLNNAAQELQSMVTSIKK